MSTTRDRLHADVEAFLAAGGEIQQCPPGPMPSRRQRQTGSWNWQASQALRELMAADRDLEHKILEIVQNEEALALTVHGELWAGLPEGARTRLLMGDPVTELFEDALADMRAAA